jgi:hypothetical protein
VWRVLFILPFNTFFISDFALVPCVFMIVFLTRSIVLWNRCCSGARKG